MPDPQLLVRTFGSLIRAYEMAGLPRSIKHAFVETKEKLADERSKLMSEVETLIRSVGAASERTLPFTLLLNGCLTLRLDVAVPRNPSRGLRNWRVSGGPSTDFTIVGRMEPFMGGIVDYFLLSSADLALGPVYIKDTNLENFAAKRFESVSAIFGKASHQVSPC
jgi:hypothetical protein